MTIMPELNTSDANTSDVNTSDDRYSRRQEVQWRHWLADERLEDAVPAAELLCVEHGFSATEPKTLRHMPGRRVTATVTSPDHRIAILKVFSSPRARGNHRRLLELQRSRAAAVLPKSIAVDPSGRVGLLTFTPGERFDHVDDDLFLEVANAAGRMLRLLHDSGAQLDREWTFTDEASLLRLRAPKSLLDLVEGVLDDAVDAGMSGVAGMSRPTQPAIRLVPSHRDFHPRQIIVNRPVSNDAANLSPKHDPAAVFFIDLDDAAMAPPGLDVGNMIAHLRRETILNVRSSAISAEAIEEFRLGYGNLPPQVELWEQLALTRLACLAERRHDDSLQRDRIAALVMANRTAKSKHTYQR
jgi:Phosphotransferase enzyme family